MDSKTTVRCHTTKDCSRDTMSPVSEQHRQRFVSQWHPLGQKFVQVVNKGRVPKRYVPKTAAEDDMVESKESVSTMDRGIQVAKSVDRTTLRAQMALSFSIM